ncbi:unnamed protein product [Hymenolepis diminuta]|uniref:Uncharacterized protein n=1 Tax=Hymenolepis diminuta TaxID=6216 RepID=A0A564YLK3_HYMDI|nr:unnamed protein product [Hymenolepis diminuta]
MRMAVLNYVTGSRPQITSSATQSPRKMLSWIGARSFVCQVIQDTPNNGVFSTSNVPKCSSNSNYMKENGRMFLHFKNLGSLDSKKEISFFVSTSSLEGGEVPHLHRNLASVIRERLATRKVVFGNTVVSIFNSECSNLETELKLPDRICWRIGSFQSESLEALRFSIK